MDLPPQRGGGLPERRADEGLEGSAAPGKVVDVVIVSWNVRDLLLRCLATVESSAAVDRVVVVDNGSRDGSVEAVRARFPGLTVLERPDNPGFAVANNVAFRALGLNLDRAELEGAALDTKSAVSACEAPYVLILNPDTELAADAVARLARVLGDHPEAAAVGPLLRYSDGSVQSSRRRFPSLAVALTESTPIEWHWPGHRFARRYRMDDAPIDEAMEVDWLSGAAILLRRAAVEAMGGFDEAFFMYSEELDLCRRLRAAGWTVRFEPAAVVIHHEARSSEKVPCARHKRFTRSRVQYFRKHHGPATSTFLRAGLRAQFAFEWSLEAAKYLVGHRRTMRRERMRCYASVVRGM